MMDGQFWAALDQLVAASQIVIDRPKGSAHPKYPACVYPVDYGYLAGTSSMDGEGIDIWHGTGTGGISAIICTVDLMKRDSEIKLLLNCTPVEADAILAFHNDSAYMKGILISRNAR